MAQRGVGEIVPAPAQPLLADPPAEREAFTGEHPVQLADRDVARQRDGLGRQPRIAQVREGIVPELATRRSPAPAGVSGHGPQCADREVEPGMSFSISRVCMAAETPSSSVITRGS